MVFSMKAEEVVFFSLNIQVCLTYQYHPADIYTFLIPVNHLPMHPEKYKEYT